ncbi:hypothetical protein [Bradyrhizobium sp. BWA-3-5]|uniref:hypothetical protein n=1 Tax=Bradyrhizobium sp. BWA-3-5 TaxID=3080013 RepID=UPI00293EEA54|nr:hypothetical protein [Bradyrhizobium sp. BWA-3-5]WOH67131.1 hypothetical protein RX331_05030 [Bradyrhizobium sp. BWA-3-5]
MAAQIVMDQSGDTRFFFNHSDATELASAEKRFMELTGAGFTAAVRLGPGECRAVKSFDGTAEETLFYPRLIGG